MAKITTLTTSGFFAKNYLPGVDQLVLAIGETGLEIRYDGTQQQLYVSNSSGVSITCAFRSGYILNDSDFFVIPSDGILTVETAHNVYFSSPSGIINTAYNVDSAGDIQELKYVSLYLGTAIYSVRGSMSFDGTRNNIFFGGY